MSYRFQQMLRVLSNTGRILSGPKSIVHPTSVMGLLGAVVVNDWMSDWNTLSSLDGLFKFSKIYQYIHFCTEMLITWNFSSFAASRHKLPLLGWWAEALPGVSGFSNHRYRWMPFPLYWHTRILRGFKYESEAANSISFGWETSTKWGYGGRKERKQKWISVIEKAIGFLFCCL